MTKFYTSSILKNAPQKTSTHSPLSASTGGVNKRWIDALSSGIRMSCSWNLLDASNPTISWRSSFIHSSFQRWKSSSCFCYSFSVSNWLGNFQKLTRHHPAGGAVEKWPLLSVGLHRSDHRVTQLHIVKHSSKIDFCCCPTFQMPSALFFQQNCLKKLPT